MSAIKVANSIARPCPWSGKPGVYEKSCPVIPVEAILYCTERNGHLLKETRLSHRFFDSFK